MQPAVTKNSAIKLEDSEKPLAANPDQVKELETSLSETRDATKDALKKFEFLKKLEEEGLKQPDSAAKTAALKKLSEAKIELRGELDKRIQKLIQLANSARELSTQFNECLDLYQEYKAETNNLLSLLRGEQKQETHSVENVHAKINFKSYTTSGQRSDSSQYLKLDQEGALLCWANTAKVGSGQAVWEWVKAEELNEKPNTQKTICLYQQSDGSFRDAEGKTVTQLDSYAGRKNIAEIKPNLAEITVGKISGLRSDEAGDLFYKGARVVFTKSAAEHQLDLKADSELRLAERANAATEIEQNQTKQNVDYQAVGFSVKSCDGTRVQSTQYFKLDDAGELKVWQRRDSSLNVDSQKDYSWQKAEESNKQPYRMKFQCLYQEADGSFTDANGKTVKSLDSYNGRVSMSEIGNKIEATQVGIVSGMKANSANEYFYEGAQVVFTKRAAAVVSEDKKTTQESLPFRKISYHEVDPRGVGHEKSLYARKDADHGLEIFTGKDQAGNDIWQKETESNYRAIYIHDGKAFDSAGNIVDNLTTGGLNSNAKVSTASLINSVSFDQSGIGTLPDTMFRAQGYEGKPIVFLKGAPPK